jgi:penicillin-binding protein 1A
MVNAFGAFANGGIRVAPYTIERVEDKNGHVLKEHVPIEREAISPQLAYLISYLMEGVVQNGTARYAKRLNRPLAGKTGTTNDNKDLWFVGFTPDLVSAAWMGYDDFTSLGRPNDITGGSTVVPWWTEIMSQILKDKPKNDFLAPDHIVFRPIDKTSGFLALPSCPRKSVILEAYPQGRDPTAYCPLDHSKPLGPQLIKLLAAQQEAQRSGTEKPVAISSSSADSLSIPEEILPASSTNSATDHQSSGEENSDNSTPFILE